MEIAASHGISYRNLPIRRKLQLIILVSSGLALSIVCISVLAHAYVFSRDAMSRDLEVQADILSANTTAALTFDDPKAAVELLHGLEAKPFLTEAWLFRADGRALAEFRRSRKIPEPNLNPLQADRTWFEGSRLKVFKNIWMQGARIGAVYVETDLSDVRSGMVQFAGWMAVLLFAALALSLALAERLQRVVFEPLAELTGAATQVSCQKDYSVRARKLADDDLGALTDTFNAMLTEIQRHDEDLRYHQDDMKSG